MASSRVTITDVAREAGVALGSVSNALNHPERVRPETLELINRAIDKLGYAPNQNARMLAGGSSRFIGLVLPNMDHGVSLQIANGANSEARKHGYGLLIANAEADDQASSRYMGYFAGTHMAGVLLQPITAHGDELPRAPGGMPIVYLDYEDEGEGHFVSPDNRAQGSLLAQHAIDSGAARIAVIGQNAQRKFEYRLEGIHSTRAARPDISFEFIDEGAWNVARDGFRLGSQLAQRPVGQRPDFIIALSDVLATGAIAGIQSEGLRVPRDIKVAGCDGNPLAWTGSVPLTTTAPTGYEIGRRGVRHLLDQVAARQERKRAGGRKAADGAAPSAEGPASGNHLDLIRPFLVPRASSGEGNSSNFTDPYLDISGYL